MTDQFRALCANLTAALNDWQCETGDDRYEGLIDRARTALADEPAVPKGREPASVTGQPSDEDLLGIACQSIEPYDKIRPGEYEAENNCAIEVYGSELVTFARAVLARWGNPTPQPLAEGEVAELVAWLRANALTVQKASGNPANGAKQRMNRAAELLERLSPPQPQPVSERLPEPEDCDAEGRCWWFALETEVDFGAWTLGTPEACTGDNWGHTHWLPAHALPLPGAD